MGAGKSAIGRELARRLDRPFHDTDAEVERRTGVEISRIFEVEGESGFRKRERDVAEALTRLPGIVLATGGGLIGDPQNRALLIERGTVIYLFASIAQQADRTRVSRTRPMLESVDPQQRLAELFALRDPLYREVADITVRTDRRRVAAVVTEILERLDD